MWILPSPGGGPNGSGPLTAESGIADSGIAALGMYDRVETAAAHDRFWALIRDGFFARGIKAPLRLTRGEMAFLPGWLSPDLVFAQTCGYPFRALLQGRVTLVGTPDYGLKDCPPGHYNSVFIARRDDPRPDLPAFSGSRFAFNDPMSQSGWAAPQTHAAAIGLQLPPALKSGAHRLSALAVAQGRADLAAIDALTWELLKRHDAFTASLREITRTAPTPALPYIAGLGVDGDAAFAALQDAVAALDPADRETLHLRGVLRLPAEAYLAVPDPPAPEQIAPAL